VTDPLIAFAGTPEFAVPTLEAILSFGAKVPVVLTQPDRRAGRGRRPSPSAVKQAAERAGLHVEQPARLADESLLRGIGPRPDLLVVAAYGLLLPSWVLGWARRGAVNVHASLLPRWRGAAPIQRAILAGDRETGISIMQMDAGLDTGPVFASARVPITETATAASLHDELASLGAATLERLLPGILAGELWPEPQNDARACYAPKVTKSEATIDWRCPAVEIDRKVRAFNAWPVAEGELSDGRRLRIWQAELLAEPAPGAPGSILRADAAGIVVATGHGAIRLTRVQPPSARAMSAEAYLAAHPVGQVSFVVVQ
jgi:methionyl-tRNA formyltransferase